MLDLYPFIWISFALEIRLRLQKYASPLGCCQELMLNNPMQREASGAVADYIPHH